jgi:hypothetical protein
MSDETAENLEHPPGYPPCPGCGEPGHSIQVWKGEDETQMWHCPDQNCRVEEYAPRDCDPQDDPGGIGL